MQRTIKSPVKHLRQRYLQKLLTVFAKTSIPELYIYIYIYRYIDIYIDIYIYIHIYIFSCDSLHARLNSYYEAWSYKKKKHKKMTGYRKSV